MNTTAERHPLGSHLRVPRDRVQSPGNGNGGVSGCVVDVMKLNPDGF